MPRNPEFNLPPNPHNRSIWRNIIWRLFGPMFIRKISWKTIAMQRHREDFEYEFSDSESSISTTASSFGE
ncbi:hypothetical protein SNEBB_005553 [Seison nebaliae]|nr:hypothetical protein SNEBB_005553 [Seison nebaliae]